MSELRRYIAESHLPRIRRGDLRDAATRARLAADALTAEGWSVRHVDTTFLLDDEVCLHIFEAPCAGAVEEAMRRAALAADRIVEAIR